VSLPEFVYDRWGVTVYHGDALDVMRELPDASVDSVVTDPPAGVSFSHPIHTRPAPV
jgi:DNA modification methylase